MLTARLSSYCSQLTISHLYYACDQTGPAGNYVLGHESQFGAKLVALVARFLLFARDVSKALQLHLHGGNGVVLGATCLLQLLDLRPDASAEGSQRHSQNGTA